MKRLTTNQGAVTRRDFLRGAGIASGALAIGGLAGCAAPSEQALGDTSLAESSSVPPRFVAEVPEAWDKEADVLVLGCGIAGACCAVEAYDLGKSVMAIDALADIKDCSCRLSGGWLCGCNTRLQAEEGIEDSVDLFVQDVRKDGGDCGDPDIIRAWAEISGETVDWLEEIGCDVVQRVYDAKSAGSDSHSIARDYVTNPAGDGLGWMQGLEDAIAERDIDLMLETVATKLYRNGEGRVVGAQVTCADGSTLDLKGNEGVVVALGGVGNNLDMWAEVTPSMRPIRDEAKRVNFSAPKTVNGDSFTLLKAVDSRMYDVPPNYGGHNTLVSSDGEGEGSLPYIWSAGEGLIEVNADGVRFNDETSFEDAFNRKLFNQNPGMWNVIIFDDETRQSESGQTYVQSIIDKVASAGLDTAQSADSLEELAEKFGIPAEQLKKSVDEYNAHVDSQEPDEFGRSVFAKKIEVPPFWGLEGNVNVATSKGGAKINTKAQVIDNCGNVIPGLYAAGESAFAQIHGNASTHIVGGCNSSAACYGRIAARTIAEGA